MSDETSLHWSRLPVESLRPLVIIFQCLNLSQSTLLTVVAKYHGNERQVAVNVVKDFWDGEFSRPNESHLQKRNVMRMT